ncbi:MAG: hypothetical protein ABIT92_01745 [Gammaproteobacteria bacterium]
MDEVHVIDSGSEHDTLKISAELGAQRYIRAWTGYGESLRRNHWLLNLSRQVIGREGRRNDYCSATSYRADFMRSLREA